MTGGLNKILMLVLSTQYLSHCLMPVTINSHYTFLFYILLESLSDFKAWKKEMLESIAQKNVAQVAIVFAYKVALLEAIL